MQYVDANGRITIMQAQNIITTIKRPTIKNRFNKLVNNELLIRHGKTKGTWYAIS
jgi:predicted HTH transcriptional regulator